MSILMGDRLGASIAMNCKDVGEGYAKVGLYLTSGVWVEPVSRARDCELVQEGKPCVNAAEPDNVISSFTSEFVRMIALLC